MNLHAVANPVVTAVNPQTRVTLRRSMGYTTAADGTRAPTFVLSNARAQVQGLTYRDLLLMDGLQLNGERRSIHLYGKWSSANRPAGGGGDVVIFPDGGVWLVVFVFEAWPGWCRVAVTLQNETAQLLPPDTILLDDQGNRLLDEGGKPMAMAG